MSEPLQNATNGWPPKSIAMFTTPVVVLSTYPPTTDSCVTPGSGAGSPAPHAAVAAGTRRRRSGLTGTRIASPSRSMLARPMLARPHVVAADGHRSRLRRAVLAAHRPSNPRSECVLRDPSGHPICRQDPEHRTEGHRALGRTAKRVRPGGAEERSGPLRARRTGPRDLLRRTAHGAAARRQ